LSGLHEEHGPRVGPRGASQGRSRARRRKSKPPPHSSASWPRPRQPPSSARPGCCRPSRN